MASRKSDPKRIVFLSQDSMDGYVCDDDLALPAFADASLVVDTLSWRRTDVDWAAYAAVIVRSTWDYQRAPEAFFAALQSIDQQTRLANPLPMMRWNMDKHYLAGLAEQGVATVPTTFGRNLDAAMLDRLLSAHAGECVIKPVISAGAERTYRLSSDADAATREEIVQAHASGAWMWQPFIADIIAEGEYSLFYFDGEFSHAIVKKPQQGDFRVQEEFGGLISAIAAPSDMRSMADRVMSVLEATPLYARVDLVRGDADQWWLIELELIEPSLYLRTDRQAPHRFAKAVREWIDRGQR
ncbi:MAG: hypothetical protein AAF270_08355 [Pseudomonadota bacterium]